MYFTYSLLIVTSLYSIYKWKTAALVKEKNILEEKVTERIREVVQQKERAEIKEQEALQQKVVYAYTDGYPDQFGVSEKK